MRRSAIAFAMILVASLACPAYAGGPTGRWNRDDGRGGIVITRCGAALCGRIAWLRDTGTPAHIGQRVLFDMRATAANVWTGSAFNPEDGRTYVGTMTLSGSRLLTRGCILGGLICRTVTLSRPR